MGTKNGENNSPKPSNITSKAIILHTFGVQVGASVGKVSAHEHGVLGFQIPGSSFKVQS